MSSWVWGAQVDEMRAKAELNLIALKSAQDLEIYRVLDVGVLVVVGVEHDVHRFDAKPIGIDVEQVAALEVRQRLRFHGVPHDGGNSGDLVRGRVERELETEHR